jgi:hypothetical protein
MEVLAPVPGTVRNFVGWRRALDGKVTHPDDRTGPDRDQLRADGRGFLGRPHVVKAGSAQE